MYYRGRSTKTHLFCFLLNQVSILVPYWNQILLPLPLL